MYDDVNTNKSNLSPMISMLSKYFNKLVKDASVCVKILYVGFF